MLRLLLLHTTRTHIKQADLVKEEAKDKAEEKIVDEAESHHETAHHKNSAVAAAPTMALLVTMLAVIFIR